VSCEMVLLFLKAIFALVCLKRLVIFLIYGVLNVKIAHFLVMSVSVFGCEWAFLY
jgi:hypothetical protein